LGSNNRCFLLHLTYSEKCVVGAFAEVSGQDVASQYPREKTEIEGQSVILNCNISRLAIVFWYRQNPGGALQYELRIFASGKVDKSPDLPERFTAELFKENKVIKLQILGAVVATNSLY
uniref:Immunoglobulin V-set domain-containing protein n=1 Tax=Callorhinchus milii TaxID=7868 RepID=A0A4W3IY88_CALMI